MIDPLRVLTVVAGAVALAALVACGSDARSRPPQQSALSSGPPQRPFSAPIRQKPFYGPGTMSPEQKARVETEKKVAAEAAGAKAKANEPLSDSDILGVLGVAGVSEIEMAEVAQRNAASPDVKRYAVMTATQHKAEEGRMKTLVVATKIDPTSSAISAQMGTDLAATTTQLREMKGTAFDRAYMDAQVRLHRDQLSAIDDRLTPSAASADVKRELGATRTMTVAHLARAESLQRSVEEQPAAAPKRDGGT